MFRNWSNYEYYFIIKELAEEIEGRFTCLRENTEKYLTFSVTVEKKVTRTVKKDNKWQKPYLTNHNLLIRFMTSSSSNPVNNLAEEIHNTTLNVNMGMIVKNEKRLELNTKTVNATLNIQPKRWYERQ